MRLFRSEFESFHGFVTATTTTRTMTVAFWFFHSASLRPTFLPKNTSLSLISFTIDEFRAVSIFGIFDDRFHSSRFVKNVPAFENRDGALRGEKRKEQEFTRRCRYYIYLVSFRDHRRVFNMNERDGQYNLININSPVYSHYDTKNVHLI